MGLQITGDLAEARGSGPQLVPQVEALGRAVGPTGGWIDPQGVPRGQDEEGVRVGVQPVRGSWKTLVLTVCLLYTQAVADTFHPKLRRMPANCCQKGCPAHSLSVVCSTQPRTV